MQRANSDKSSSVNLPLAGYFTSLPERNPIDLTQYVTLLLLRITEDSKPTLLHAVSQ